MLEIVNADAIWEMPAKYLLAILGVEFRIRVELEVVGLKSRKLLCELSKQLPPIIAEKLFEA